MEANKEFWDKVLKLENGCWQWYGACSNGYGVFCENGIHIKAHRYAYETMVGAVPDGLELDHLCRNKRCVNPEHLEAVTRGENIKRGLLPDIGRRFQQGKMHCPWGHPYNSQNTYLRLDRAGRECKACRREAQLKWRLSHARS